MMLNSAKVIPQIKEIRNFRKHKGCGPLPGSATANEYQHEIMADTDVKYFL